MASGLPERLPFARSALSDSSAFACDTRMRQAALTGAEVVGFVDLDPVAGRVHYVVVSPPSQGKGIGSRLMEFAEAAIEGPVVLGVLAVNERALAWYRRRGYLVTGRRHEPSWHGGPVDWLELRKPPALSLLTRG